MAAIKSCRRGGGKVTKNDNDRSATNALGLEEDENRMYYPIQNSKLKLHNENVGGT